ncbi:MAG: aminotransferase class III-fold pyridoxal phosphate-dependent enzyme, partial [Chloroflexi bacterium]|nr:aminotransferase class III-fold pyridoxal phosphate-dependent enzyme [Chloroflexota bacterium]
AYQEPFEPMPSGFTHVPLNDLDAVDDSISSATAAVMVELVQGESGVRMADVDYVQGLRRVCDEHGVLLIFDEVQTGIGRTGRLFGYENFGVTPDLIGLAKGLGGGLPIGAVLSSEAVSVLAPGEHGSTFGGSPVACAAARVVLDRVMASGFLDEVRAKGEHVQARLRDSAGQGARITGVRGLGLMIGFDLESEDVATEAVEKARSNGLLLIKAGPATIRIVPPLTITMDELDEGLDALDAARGA